ncbi:MAG: hypothetical protein MUP53_07015 [Bacteroidales bacterium]|nr:hypothetical protein [Bacteroidales bacterium]
MTTPLSPGRYQESTNGLFDEDSIDFKRYFSMFLYNWYWFAISLFIAFCLVYGINRYSEKIFTVSSTLLIKVDPAGSGLSGSQAVVMGSDLFNSRQNLNNEIGILKSYKLNKRVIDSLPDFHIVYVGVGRRNIVERRLYKDSPFIVIPDTERSQPSTKINIKIISRSKYRIEINNGYNINEDWNFGDLFDKNGFSFRVYLRNADDFVYDEDLSNKYFFWFNSSEVIANFYRTKLDISPIEKDATLLNLSLAGPVAEQEMDYLNVLMKLYIIQGLEYKNETADSTISFINDQIRSIFKTLSSAETELEEFRRSKKLVDLSSEGTFLKGRVEKYENEKTEIELQKKYYEYLNEYIESRNEFLKEQISGFFIQ